MEVPVGESKVTITLLSKVKQVLRETSDKIEGALKKKHHHSLPLLWNFLVFLFCFVFSPQYCPRAVCSKTLSLLPGGLNFCTY